MVATSSLYGSHGAQWPKPVYSSPMFPHYGMMQWHYRKFYVPGFRTDDNAGSAILLTFNGGNYIERFDYVDKTNTAISTGIWGSGVVPSDFPDANNFLGFYMDDSADLLYVVLNKTSTTPDQVQLSTVNKAGAITSGGWQTPSSVSFDFNGGSYTNNMGALVRTDGDGSGTTFTLNNTRWNISAANNLTPYRGATMTFNSSTGALTESHLVPDTAQGLYGYYGNFLGPTSNNIIGAPYGGTYKINPSGSLFNATTGNGFTSVLWPQNRVGIMTEDNGNFGGGRWRGYYWIAQKTVSPSYVPFYNIADIDNMLDEMAREHGIL